MKVVENIWNNRPCFGKTPKDLALDPQKFVGPEIDLVY